jgi:hypothetical protein
MPDKKSRSNSVTRNAKGDLVVGTAAATSGVLAVGSNGQVLTAASGQTTGLQWATPSSSGVWSQIATGSLTGSSVNVTGLTGRTLYIAYTNMSGNGMNNSRIQFNGDTTGNYVFGTPVNTTSAASNNLYVSLNGSMTDSQNYSGGFFIYFADTSLNTKPLLHINDGTGSGAGFGHYVSTSAITSVRFYGNAGTFDNGTYYIWSMS